MADTQSLYIKPTGEDDLTAYPHWITVGTFDFTDFSVGLNSNTISTGYSIPSRAIVHACALSIFPAFSGGTISNYTLSVGVSGSVAKYFTATSVFSGVPVTKSLPQAIIGTEDNSSPAPITVTAVSTNDTLDHAIAGAAEIHLLISILP